MRTGFTALRRDRGALAMSFILPVAFFTIFAVIFGGRRDTPRISVIVVDEDHSRASQQLISGLRQESLSVKTRPAPKRGAEQPDYTAASAEAAVKAGVAPVALIIPKGFGATPISFGGGGRQPSTIQLLKDSSDMVAPQMITGLLQKVAMTSMPEVMASEIRCKPPILLIHGDSDDLIPPQALFQAANALAALGLTAEWHLSPGLGHGIDQEGLRHGAEFLARRMTGR